MQFEETPRAYQRDPGDEHRHALEAEQNVEARKSGSASDQT